MLFQACVVSLLALARSVRAESSVVPGKYLIEFEDNQPDVASFEEKIADDATKTRDLNFKLFKGAAIEVLTKENPDETAAKIAELPMVKKVWPIRVYDRPDPRKEWVGNPDNVSMPTGEATKRAPSDLFSTHVQTQVNQLKAKGFTGEGIKLAVIDSGVDYRHPDLGGCFGPGCLVSFGYDLVGDAYDGFNTPRPDVDPFDCDGHGTHVSGIIAAQGNNKLGIIGAAPGVTLGMYKVFGCEGQTSDDVLIAAFNMAYESGADLITASIGGASGWTEGAWSVVVSRIVENGVPCTLSAGNKGEYGLFYASSASNGKGATSVASVDNTIAPVLFSNASYTVNEQQNTTFGYTAGNPAQWANVKLPLVAINFDTNDTANGCDPLDANLDLTQSIVLIRRGSCTFVQKIQNAVARGAQYVIFYNNVPGTLQVDGQSVVGVRGIAMVSAQQGAEWINTLSKGSRLVVGMTDPTSAPKTLVNSPNAESPSFPSVYTSWGPTYEADVKPQFSAPGGMVLSTFPTAQGSYAVLSGTSMACPLTAAVYALIMNARKTKDPGVIEALLASTAKPNFFNDGRLTRTYLAPVPQQGAGLIQAYDAAYATTLLSVSSLAFNDTDHHNAFQNFTITNEGRTSIIYTLGHVGAATAYTFVGSSIYPDTFPNDMEAKYASLSFTPGPAITIPAGQRRIISVSATPPAGVDASRLAVYSGYIAINGSDGSALSLPYMGIHGSLRAHVVLGRGNAYISDSRDRSYQPVAENTTFILPPAGHANDTSYRNRTSLPTINIGVALGSALVRVDLVPVNICGNRTTTEVLGVKILGEVDGFPMEYVPRLVPYRGAWDGKLSDGTYAPPGQYKLLVRALRITGDRTKGSEYDGVEAQTFRIRYRKLLVKRQVEDVCENVLKKV